MKISPPRSSRVAYGCMKPGGLLESIYKECLIVELEAGGHRVDRSRKLRLVYKGHDLKTDFWPDIVVDDLVVVELKAVEKLAPVHKAQVITYLKLTEPPGWLADEFQCSVTSARSESPCAPGLAIENLNKGSVLHVSCFLRFSLLL